MSAGAKEAFVSSFKPVLYDLTTKAAAVSSKNFPVLTSQVGGLSLVQCMGVVTTVTASLAVASTVSLTVVALNTADFATSISQKSEKQAAAGLMVTHQGGQKVLKPSAAHF